MPDLLLGGLDLKGKPLEVLAMESVTDVCQLEDFKADVPAACASVCEKPVTSWAWRCRVGGGVGGVPGAFDYLAWVAASRSCQ